MGRDHFRFLNTFRLEASIKIGKWSRLVLEEEAYQFRPRPLAEPFFAQPEIGYQRLMILNEQCAAC